MCCTFSPVSAQLSWGTSYLLFSLLPCVPSFCSASFTSVQLDHGLLFSYPLTSPHISLLLSTPSPVQQTFLQLPSLLSLPSSGFTMADVGQDMYKHDGEIMRSTRILRDEEASSMFSYEGISEFFSY